MRTSFLIATITTIFLLALVGYAQWPTEDIPPVQPVALLPVKKAMKPFRSERELASYFRELAQKQKRKAEKHVAQLNSASGLMTDSATPAQPATLGKEGESITNTQEAGVDEGGIVKLHGDHLTNEAVLKSVAERLWKLAIAARSDRAVDDACRASCVDWYGNARPLFFGGRVLALLGYEIVEGTVDDGRMRELRRVSYAPHRLEITSR